jgi:hypothetical protein
MRPGELFRAITVLLTVTGILGAQTLPKPILGTVTEFKVDSLEFGVKPDHGDISFVRFGPETEVVRIAPSELDLAKAEPAKLTDIARGDRVLVSFVAGMTEARRIVVISANDLAKRDEAARQDWRERGVSGIVASKNGSEVTLEARSMQDVRTITVTITERTVYRRYAPDSVKFADAKLSTIDEIRKGDQLQARGAKSEDGLRMTAEEVVFGTFLTRMGSITAINPDTREITIQDVTTRQPLAVRFTEDSKFKKLPDFLAMLGGKAHEGKDAPPRPRDLSQMLERLAPARFEDLKVGESVIVSSTRGSNSDAVTAITLLANADFIVQMMHPEATGQAGPHGGIDAGAFRARHGGMFSPGGLSLPAILPQ